MILLVDADSLIFASCYKKRETPEDGKYYTELSDCRNKFRRQYMEIVNHLENIYNIDKVITFSGSLGNFRKLITPVYKANRSTEQLSTEFGRNEVMIVSIDKDYKQFPCLMYNYHYKHKEVLDISEDEALYNFYEQMIAGDTADNVNYFKGKGKKFAEKYFQDCHSEYSYTKKLYQLFKEKYKSKAKEKYSECYNLLKLRTD